MRGGIYILIHKAPKIVQTDSIVYINLSIEIF
jgi:hypothetical protein